MKDFREIVKESLNEKLRAVKVTYSDGSVVNTNMSANLSDEEIKDYYKVGKEFNVGDGPKDKMVKVKKVEILEGEELDESSGAMYAIKSLMDKYKKTPSKSEKEKLAGEMKQHEDKLAKSPYWKNATIGKDYQKFKKETLDFS